MYWSAVPRVFYFNTGSGFNAFDACPNKLLVAARQRHLKVCICVCDNTEYSLFTGPRRRQYPLKQYRSEWKYRVYN
jgi:hypothetical protein